jgi:biotin operon repressor
MKISEKKKADLLLFVTAIGWAMSTIIIKLYVEDIPVFHQSVSFDLKISKKEWAEQLGIQRTSLSRALQKMQKKGWLSYKNHHYQLLNYEIFNTNTSIYG